MPAQFSAKLPFKARAVAFAAGLLLLGAPPALAQVFNPETFTLDNGLQVVVVENRRAPVVTHMVWYRAGSADEHAGTSGIAHFLEHLMFKGTETVPSGEFSKIVRANGGQDNAFTSWDYTGYYQTIARDRLELVMELEADRMVNLVLSEEDVATERKVILEERSSRTDNRPAALLGEQIRAALFMNHPYGRPIIGWRHEMETLSREDALDWYRTFYAPNNAILVVAGDIDAEELRPLAEKYYGVIPARELPPRVRPQEPVQHAPRQVELSDPKVQQPSWRRTYLAPSQIRGASEHSDALTVLAELLGGSANSRLYTGLVVEQGLAVSVGAYYEPDSLDLGSFGFWGSPRPGGDPREDLAKIEAAIEAEIESLLQDGVSEDEVERAKKRLLAGAVYARDGLSTGARVLGQALSTGKTIEDVESWPDRVRAVTADQVLAAAKHVFVPNRSVTGLLLPQPAS